MSVSIQRIASAELLARVRTLIDILFESKYENELSMNELRDILEDENHFLITYTAEDGIIAAITLGIKVRTLTRTVMLYEELVVDPTYRRRGIGSAIDEFVKELATKEGCDCIEGTVAIHNTPALMQHLRTGYILRNQLPLGITIKKWRLKS